MKSTLFSLPKPGADDQLILQALKGDEKAFSSLVQRHHAKLRTAIGRYLRDTDDVQEAIQDTFVRAFQALPSFRQECQFSTWISRIGVSVAINRLKSRQHRSRMREQNELSDKIELLSPAEAPISLERQEFQRLLRQAILRLPRQDASVIQLYYLQEQSLEEICNQTGMSASNVKSRLFRARQKLKQLLPQSLS